MDLISFSFCNVYLTRALTYNQIPHRSGFSRGYKENMYCHWSVPSVKSTLIYCVNVTNILSSHPNNSRGCLARATIRYHDTTRTTNEIEIDVKSLVSSFPDNRSNLFLVSPSIFISFRVYSRDNDSRNFSVHIASNTLTHRSLISFISRVSKTLWIREQPLKSRSISNCRISVQRSSTKRWTKQLQVVQDRTYQTEIGISLRRS